MRSVGSLWVKSAGYRDSPHQWPQAQNLNGFFVINMNELLVILDTLALMRRHFNFHEMNIYVVYYPLYTIIKIFISMTVHLYIVIESRDVYID